MTLEEFHNLKHSEYVYIDEELYQYQACVCNDVFVKASELTSFYYCVNRRNEVWCYIDGQRICDFNFNEFLKTIKPKQKESKMKTTFKQEPKNTSENSFPKFMKSKTTTLTILFFNEDSGIVVVEDSDWRVNTFGDDWNISLFEPIENCEVTFSNKE